MSCVKHTQPLPAWDEWLRRISNGATQTAIGKKIGVSRATVSRWSTRGVMDPNTVLALARAYAVDPIEGLLVGGWLLPADLTASGVREIVRRAPTRYLVDELCDRVPNAGSVMLL